jgi:hypothetical protein
VSAAKPSRRQILLGTGAISIGQSIATTAVASADWVSISAIENALTMTMGMDWDEVSVRYSNPTNSEVAMDMEPDRYRFILGTPVLMEPGQALDLQWRRTALLARIIAKGTGKSVQVFARETLFDPLGIGPTVYRSRWRSHCGIWLANDAARSGPRRLDDVERR